MSSNLNPYQIERASSEDLDVILEIDRAAFAAKDVWDHQLMEGSIKSEGSRVLLAKSGPEVIGFIVVETGGRVMKICVVSSFRKRGVGGLLLNHGLSLIDGEFRKSALVASLHVDADNTTAVRLYESRGFSRDGPELKDYYSPGRNAWRMIREKKD